jgi:hypothetical protein
LYRVLTARLSRAATSEGDAPNPKADPSGKDIPKPISPIEQTTVDAFHAMNSYREEVRSEMMQTLLDDRHDIQGNTIYRLAFQTSVLSGSRERELALINVKLLHDPLNFTSDYTDVYNDWMRYFQTVVSASLNSLTLGLASRKLEPRMRLMISAFLRDQVCRKMFLQHSSVVESSCNPWARPFSEQIYSASQLINAYVSSFSNYRKAIARARFSLDWSVVLNKEGLQESDFPLAFEAVARYCDDARERAAQEQKTGTIPINAVKFPIDQSKTVDAPCPLFPDPYEGILAGLLLYNLMLESPKRFSELWKESPSNPEKVGVALFGDTRELFCLVPEITRGQLRCSAAEYILWSLNSFGDNQDRRSHRIDDYFDAQIVGHGLQDCNLVVREKRDGNVVIGLQKDLNDEIELVAYSVSPKNQATRVASSFNTQELLGILLNKPLEVATESANAGVESKRGKTERRDTVEVQATVVSLGSSHNYVGRSAPSNTDFGWAIIPRNEDSEFSLTAVISVPGWWRSALLVVTTCWMGRDQLKDFSNVQDTASLSDVRQGSIAPVTNKDLCKVGTSISSRSELVRLPGSVEEVSRKLGFEVVQEPYLDDDQLAPQVLYAGYQGEILLTGGRLWRSTEVTLGSQRADRIIVLPNMTGIIAKFDCVVAQTGSRETPNFVDVRVWTSEGATTSLPRLVEVKAGGAEMAAIGGFKPCSSTGGNRNPQIPTGTPAPVQ